VAKHFEKGQAPATSISLPSHMSCVYPFPTCQNLGEVWEGMKAKFT